MSYPKPSVVTDFQQACSSNDWDALVVISPDLNLPDATSVADFLTAAGKVDLRIGKEPVLMVNDLVPGSRLIFSPTGALARDYDDSRRFYDAANKAAELVRASGAKRPLFYINGAPDTELFSAAAEVAYFGASQALWQPLEARESKVEAEIEPVEEIGIFSNHSVSDCWLGAVELGRRAARDLCGTEPERMSPPKFAEYCEALFEGTPVKVEVIKDRDTLEQDYPLLSAVARASWQVERHHPRVIRLEYTGEGDIDRTLMFSGKGLVYDTGGTDLKVGGAMAGMSRDKGGGAAVAGFIKAVAELKPKGLKVIAEIGAVRNSIGSDAFVTDEIVTAKNGIRIRVGCTDAEGRLVMGDILGRLAERAVDEVNPELFTVATLTGHAARAMGPYTALVENGPARRNGVSQKMAYYGDMFGDPAELSRSRREDWDFVKPKTLADDLLSSNTAPSSVTARGHQFPLAFLAIASGLDKHGNDSDQPLPFVHIDVAGSAVENGDWQHGKPTAAAVLMMAATYLR
ncbi:M17 family metallopeptidase [Flocculibacter collagenilyticus]|uniref:leucyl aminopeptidase family protein n=1 Tax=Flocculibacter collagenilyticus TaxID=2744479 RepID=UPI0018F50CBF|nr:leucyl aminopeptidase family protein [Flocculibacter collagenilyticus]